VEAKNQTINQKYKSKHFDKHILYNADN